MTARLSTTTTTTMPRPFANRAGALVLVLVVAQALAACGRRAEAGDPDDEKAPEVQPVVGVRIAVVTAQPFAEGVGAIGTVSARPGHVAVLSAPGPTRVTAVPVAAGQRVRAGQTLVELERAAFEASAQSATAALTAAQLAYERAQRLAGEGIVPRRDVEQAAAELARARADAVAARRTAQLSVLRAPIAGVVTRLTATLGASVDASQPLVEVTDPSALDVLLTVTPNDAARVRPGASVTLSAGGGGGGGAAGAAGGEPLGDGTVADVSATVDSATRGVAVRVRVPAARRPLRVGETVSARIAVGTRAAALTVPLEALVPEGEGFKVFVVDAAGVAHARPVTVGARTEQAAEITSGLAAGERVVTYGAYGVEDSAKVVQVPR